MIVLNAFRYVALASVFVAAWSSTSLAEVDRLHLSPIDDGTYVDDSYEGSRVTIGARLDSGWMQEFLITVQTGTDAVYYYGHTPVFDSQPVDVWLYRADKNFRIKERTLESLHIETSDPNTLTGYLMGKELDAHFVAREKP